MTCMEVATIGRVRATIRRDCPWRTVIILCVVSCVAAVGGAFAQGIAVLRNGAATIRATIMSATDFAFAVHQNLVIEGDAQNGVKKSTSLKKSLVLGLAAENMV